MNYETAVSIVKENYSAEQFALLGKLDKQAIITLAKLHNEGRHRNISNYTIGKIATYPPHRQVGFLANPLMEWAIGDFIFMAPKETTDRVTIVTAPSGKNKKPKIPIQVQEPEPEPVVDDEPEISLFDMF